MASPTVNGTAATTAVSAATTAPVLNLPTGIVSGELLILVIAGISGTAPTATGWTKLSTAGQHDYLFYRVADGSEGSTVTATTPSQKTASVAFRVGGQGTDTGNWGTNGTSGSDPPNWAPGLGTLAFLWIATSYTNADSTASGFPANYSDLQSTISSGGSGGGTTKAGIAVACRRLTASSEDPGTFTWGTATTPTSSTFDITPAAAAAFIPQPPLVVPHNQAVNRASTY